MKSHWLAYSIVAVFGALVGVLVAGAPDLSAASATIAATAAPDGGSSDEAPASSEPTDTTNSTESATTTAPPTTSERPTTTTTTTTVAPIPDRADISVVSANGANIAGLAADTAEELRRLGYTDVRETNGTAIFGGTVIYYADGFDQAATRLVDDLGYDVAFIVPIDGQTPIDAEFGDADIVVYLGQDRG